LKISSHTIARNAIIGALYLALTIITYPISFLGIQFRIAEILLLLCFFRKDYVIGLTIGCGIANLCSSIGPIDSLFGIVTTLLAGLLIGFCKHLFVAALIPIVVNSFSIGAELFWFLKEPFWLLVGMVALGEFVVLLVGYIMFLVIKNKPWFYTKIHANQNIDFKF